MPTKRANVINIESEPLVCNASRAVALSEVTKDFNVLVPMSDASPQSMDDSDFVATTYPPAMTQAIFHDCADILDASTESDAMHQMRRAPLTLQVTIPSSEKDIMMSHATSMFTVADLNHNYVVC